MPTPDAVFTARTRALWPQVERPLRRLTRSRSELSDTDARIAEAAARAYADRPAALRELDESRLVAPDWFQRPELVGYLAHAERFAGSPAAVGERIDYLQQLGITLLHLLADPGQRYTPEQVRPLAAGLRARGISLLVDAGRVDPGALVERFDELAALANAGVEAIRLSIDGAAAEDHLILQVYRALLGIAAPGVLLLGEAEPPTARAGSLFGRGAAAGAECQLAYQDLVPTLLWSALAEQQVRLTRAVLGAVPPIPANAAWVLAARTPDDLDLGITDEQAAAVELAGPAHRRFLAEFYSGKFFDSFARGTASHLDPGHRSPRIAGTLASLAGLELARSLSGTRQQAETELAVRRILLLHGVLLSLGWVPMINSGDELGQCNDRSYLADPRRAADPGWLQRPGFDWAAAGRRFDPSTVECRLFSGLANLIEARRRTPQLHAQAESRAVDVGNDHVLGVLRTSPRGTVLVLANLAARAYSIGLHSAPWFAPGAGLRDLISGHPEERTLRMDPYQVRWLAEVPTAPE